MFILVTYDVSTTTMEGRRRLRRVARTCMNFGQRVQLSVFEVSIGETDFVRFRHELLAEIKMAEDSLRFYFLGETPGQRVEHHGQRPSTDFEDALIV